MPKLARPIDVSLGDARYIITTSRNGSGAMASVEIISDGTFNGTTTTARLLQSNDLELPEADWNFLPEVPLVLVSGASLLQTFSHTCQFLMVEIIQGDATAGLLTVENNFGNM